MNGHLNGGEPMVKPTCKGRFFAFLSLNVAKGAQIEASRLSGKAIASTVKKNEVTGARINLLRHFAANKTLRIAAAFVIYSIISVVYFGLPVLGHFTTSYIGRGSDPISFMWCLYWWPYAVSHGLNPFMTHAVWAPTGFNLAWSTGIPGLSFVGAPFTFSLGPIASYNILMVLSPVLAAVAAYILLHHLTDTSWPSLIGGYIFGFSSYEIGHLMGHLNLTFMFVIPLCVYFVLLFFEDEIGPIRFVVLMTVALVFQFLVSNEIFATMTVLGVIVLALAVIIFPQVRQKIVSKGKMIVAAYLLAAVLLSPYLYYVFAFGCPSTIYSPVIYSIDPLNFFLPTGMTLIGHSQFSAITGAFLGNVTSNDAYIGLPLLLLVLIYLLHFWRRRTGRMLLISLCLILLFSMGPVLHVTGIQSIRLPWWIFIHIPLIDTALPGRFMVFAFLIIAAIAAICLSTSRIKGWYRVASCGLVFLGIVSLVPNIPGGYWKSTTSTPPFFSNALYKDYLDKGETVLIIPYGAMGESMLWQAETGMYFNMAEGYVGFTPRAFTDWPIVTTFYSGNSMPDYGEQLKEFLASHEVQTVIVDDSSPESFFQLFDSLGTRPQDIGGVTLYRVPGEILSDYNNATPTSAIQEGGP